MFLKMKGLKKVVSGLVATVIAMSSLVTSVGAEGDTTNAEAAFSLKYLDSLPKEGEENFNEFLKLPDIKKLDEKREKNVKHKDGTIENVKINEEEVYGKIREKVNEIKKNVDEKKFEKEILDENIRKEYESLPEKMKIARAIYEWVANKIEYDYESYENIKKYCTDILAYDELAIKPQDAFFVYEKKMGVCAGKADLTALMMKMAEIPSTYIVSTIDNEGIDHAFNAIYLEGNNGDRKGWVLLDPTWGASKSDRNLREPVELVDMGPYQNLSGCFDWNSGQASSLIGHIGVWQKKCDESKMERHNDYVQQFEKILKEAFDEYRGEIKEQNMYLQATQEGNLQEIIDKVNEKIKPKINKLNEQFTDIIRLIDFNFYLFAMGPNTGETRTYTICTKSKTSVSIDEVKKIKLEDKKMDRQQQFSANLSNFKEFFPSFYDNKLSFQDDNKKIIAHRSHKIKEIYNHGDSISMNNCHKNIYQHVLNINGAEYRMDGTEGESHVTLSGDDKKPATNIKIPSDIVGMPLHIGGGIESIDLQGDETLNLSVANMLKKINAEKSNKYFVKDNILYSKETNEIAGIYNTSGTIEDGITYCIDLDDSGKKAKNIYLFADFSKKQDLNVKIPEFLKKFNLPINIHGCDYKRCGMGALTLERDEIVDLSEACGFKYIDITNSTRYEKRDGKIFDKKLNKELELRENKKVAIINNK